MFMKGYVAGKEEAMRAKEEEWDKAGYRVPESKLSIHSDSSKSFMREIVGAGSWQMGVLERGYMPQLSAWPERYREKNNRSAERDMEQVLKKVKEWEEEGYLEEVQEQPWCTNPLSVVVKEDLETK